MAYVTDSRRNGLFTFASTATEKLKTETRSREEVGPTCKACPGLKQNRLVIAAVIQVLKLQNGVVFSLHGKHSWAFSRLSLSSPLES